MLVHWSAKVGRPAGSRRLGCGTTRALTETVLRPSNIFLTALSALCLLSGCVEDKVVAPEPAPATDATTVAAVAPAADAPKGGQEHGKRARKPGRDRITPVYVDGELVSSLRFSELPPALNVKWHSLDHGNVVRRFALADYLTSLGVALESVKAVHLYGGRRITMIDGDEVRRAGDRIHFQFSRLTAGRPQYRHDGPVKTNTSIDKINSIAVYLNKVVPNMVGGELYLDGERQERIPYTAGEKQGGTRVYVDGRIVAHLKRRHVADAATKDLASMLRDSGVELASVKSAHIVSRDQIVRQLTGEEMGTETLTLAETDKGRIAIEQVANGQAIDAILLFANAKPVDRTGPPPDELKLPGLRPVIDDARTENTRSSAKKGS